MFIKLKKNYLNLNIVGILIYLKNYLKDLRNELSKEEIIIILTFNN